MSLTSYRAAPPRVRAFRGDVWKVILNDTVYLELSLFRFGGDLLSHVLRRSTIGATALNCRVREGIGCFARAIATKPKKRQSGTSIWKSSQNISVVPSLGCKRVAICSHVLLLIFRKAFVWLLLDQIKPIEQLVPVS